MNVAANFWRKQCFLSNRSIVWQADLCALKNLSQLHHRIERLKSGRDENHVQKLKTPLDRASRHAVRLDAEMKWLLYLKLLAKTVPPCTATTGPLSRRENLQQILSISEEELQSSR